MKTSHFKFCRKCSEKLKTQGALPYEWFICICLSHLTHQPLIEEVNDEGRGDTITHYLEINGYVVTKEVASDLILARPADHYQLEQEDKAYCLGKH